MNRRPALRETLKQIKFESCDVHKPHHVVRREKEGARDTRCHGRDAQEHTINYCVSLHRFHRSIKRPFWYQIILCVCVGESKRIKVQKKIVGRG